MLRRKGAFDLCKRCPFARPTEQALSGCIGRQIGAKSLVKLGF